MTKTSKKKTKGKNIPAKTSNKNETLYKCAKCKCTFRYYKKLLSHHEQRGGSCFYRKSDKEPFRCILCPASKPPMEVSNLRRHYLQCHVIYNEKNEKIRGKDHPRGLKYHKNISNYLPKNLSDFAMLPLEEGGGSIFRKEVKLKKSPLYVIPKILEKVYACEGCSFKTTSIAEMRQHRFTHYVQVYNINGNKDVFDPENHYNSFFNYNINEDSDLSEEDDEYSPKRKMTGSGKEIRDSQKASNLARKAASLSFGRQFQLISQSHNGLCKRFRYIFPNTIFLPG